MLKVENDKYTRLLEDYTELKQTNKDCEKEYFRIYEQNKQLQNTLNEIKKLLIPPPKTKIIKEKKLTKRQEEIMEYIVKGLSNKEIAKKMSLTLSSVKVHIHNILTNLNVNNRIKAVLIYLRDYKNIDFDNF